MSTVTVPKGRKKLLVRECLTELGVEASFGAAKKWFMKNHKLTLADATFYHVRKDMQMERQAVQPLPSKLPQFITPLPPKPRTNVLDVVKNVKELIDKLGKEEAKKLIDLL